MSNEPQVSHGSIDGMCTIGSPTGCNCLLCSMDGLDFVLVDPPTPVTEEPDLQILGCHSEAWVSAIHLFDFVMGQPCESLLGTIPRALKVFAQYAFDGPEFIGVRVKEVPALFERYGVKGQPEAVARLARATDALADWLLGPDTGHPVFRTRTQRMYDASAAKRATDPEGFYANKRCKDARYRSRKRAAKAGARLL